MPEPPHLQYYADLQNQFTLQRSPYVAIADALLVLYDNLLFSTKLSPQQVSPFDFTLLKTQPNGAVTFRWILGYDKSKFHHILMNKQNFQKNVHLLYENIDKKPKHKLSLYYKQLLEGKQNCDDIEFLSAVFHLTYQYKVPNTFNAGLIHREHTHKKADYYRATLCPDLVDMAHLPYLKIEDNPPQPQVNEKFYETAKPFLHEWIYLMLGTSLVTHEYSFLHHLYFPVYDGMLPTQRSLRGYLGIFCVDEESRDTAAKYFLTHRQSSFRSINTAYKRGTLDNIIDNYKAENEVLDPVEYWQEQIDSLHHWGPISLQTDKSHNSLFSVKDRICKISIERLFRRKAIEAFVDDELRNKYQSTVLELDVPAGIEAGDDSPYLKERFRDVAQLLDELLRTRHIMLNERRIKNEARKSAVARVMSRNMSHNIGSHVFARLCTKQNFLDRTNDEGFHKIAALNSYIRTRMDFLADLSTSTPTIASPLRFYRDIMGYFRPLHEDSSDFVWQELLLDYISGIEDLKANNIEMLFLNNGAEISLEETGADPVFASPNVLLGTHALYIILENIIRNCAKHAYHHKRHGKLRLTMDVYDSVLRKDLIEVCIYDNLGNAHSTIEGRNGARRLTQFLNDILSHSILDEDGSLRHAGWGTLEMKICAAYLRRIALDQLDAAHKPQLLRAVSVNGNLGYRFYLNRPNEILIVDGEDALSEKPLLNRRLKSQGIKIIDSREFDQELAANIEHNCLILAQPDRALVELVKREKKALPIRILSTDECLAEFPHLPLDQLKDQCQKTYSNLAVLSQQIWNQVLPMPHGSVSLLVRTEEQSAVAKWEVPGMSLASTNPRIISELDPRKSYVIYDRHGLIFEHDKSLLQEKIANRNVLYYEQVQHKQPTSFMIDDASNRESIKLEIVHELIETGLIKVVLLDERIQKISEEVTEHDTKLKEILQHMNIWMPAKANVDLDNPSCDRLTDWLEKNLESATFLVVHLGILEKLFKSNVKLIGAKFMELESMHHDLNIEVISGRGLPASIQEIQTRFIQYSQVARYILEERSKYHLCKVLFAARRSR